MGLSNEEYLKESLKYLSDNIIITKFTELNLNEVFDNTIMRFLKVKNKNTVCIASYDTKIFGTKNKDLHTLQVYLQKSFTGHIENEIALELKIPSDFVFGTKNQVIDNFVNELLSEEENLYKEN